MRSGPVGFRQPGDWGRMNPFNPCLPDFYSRTCPTSGTTATGTPLDGKWDWVALN